MPRIFLLTSLLLLLLITYGGPAYAQEPPEDTQDETEEAGTVPQPEALKQISTIIVEGNRLSVEFVNVDFGEILRSISQKAKFKLEGNSPAFSKKITTKFTDLDMDKAITRLFSMAQESNYLVSYDTKGSIALVKIPSAAASGNASSNGVMPADSQNPAVNRMRRSRMFRPGASRAPLPAVQPQPSAPQPAPQPEEDEEDEGE